MFNPLHEEKEVNTSQVFENLQKFRETKPRSNSVEILVEQFVQEKEFLVGELLCERVLSRKNQNSYVFRTHVEADFLVTPESFNNIEKSPFFVSLIDFSKEKNKNFEMMKEYFNFDEKIIKIHCNEFKAVDFVSYLDDPSFQMVFSSVFLSSLSDISIVIVDTEIISSVLSHFFKFI